MPNKAQQELQSLLDSTADTITAGDALTRLRQSRSRPGVQIPSDDEAKFAAPEALATAVGASFVLGPVGGVLLGVAQGILGKREQQNALDAWADEQGVLNQADGIFNDELERLATTTTNPNDLEQLSAMQTQKDAALRMMMSSSPDLREQGAAALAEFQTNLNAYTVRQEEQRIAKESDDARIRRELDNEQFTRYESLQDDFTNESQNFTDVMQATDIALQALSSGTPADLWAASILVNKSLDPTGIVRQEEAEAVGKMGSLWEKANVILEKARSGETILPEQRRELSGLLDTIRTTVTKHQLAREARYSDEVDDAQLPLKYHDNFRLVESTPAANPAPIIEQSGGPADEAGSAAADIVEELFPLDDSPNILQRAGSAISGGAKSLRDRLADWYSGSGRDARRAKRGSRLTTN